MQMFSIKVVDINDQIIEQLKSLGFDIIDQFKLSKVIVGTCDAKIAPLIAKIESVLTVDVHRCDCWNL
jgi:hypothetical protein